MDSIFRIDKGELRSAVRERILRSYPDLMSEVTDKLIIKSMTFLQGYAKALNHFVHLPINRGEMKTLLVDEVMEYITDELEDNKWQ